VARATQITPLDFDTAILDSSVIIKWFREGEIFREEALLLRGAYLEGKLHLGVPDLLFYEIANVLRYKPDLNQAQVQAAVRSLFDMRLERVALTPQLINRALELAYAHELTVYDAAFIACAETLGTVLITADEKLVDKVNQPARVRFLADISRGSQAS
jgi:predicted nucleic acid-binding protein